MEEERKPEPPKEEGIPVTEHEDVKAILAELRVSLQSDREKPK